MRARWRRRTGSGRTRGEAASAGTDAQDQDAADQQVRLGLQVLTMTNDWVKTADVKAAALLTAAGVVASVLYNLSGGGDAVTAVGERPAPGGLKTAGLATAVACSAFVLASAVCAATALVPSLRLPGPRRRSGGGSAREPNLLYFGDVAEHYSDAHGQRRHATAALSLFSNASRMAGAVAQQLHVNGLIAARKHRWVQRGLRCLLIGLILLAGTAILRVLRAGL